MQKLQHLNHSRPQRAEPGDGTIDSAPCEAVAILNGLTCWLGAPHHRSDNDYLQCVECV